MPVCAMIKWRMCHQAPNFKGIIEGISAYNSTPDSTNGTKAKQSQTACDGFVATVVHQFALFCYAVCYNLFSLTI